MLDAHVDIQSQAEAKPPCAIPKIYSHTEPAWEAMLQACRNAQHSILLEEYILDADTIGNRFIDIFISKAMAGVKVKLLLDWWGCKELKHSSRHKEMLDAGIDLCYFRPPAECWGIKGFSFFPRDHRKLLIVDNAHGFIGGVCIYDKITPWRDSMVHLVDEGLIEQLLYVFDATWHKCKGEHDKIKTHPAFDTDNEFSIYANAPETNENYFSQLLIKKIDAAQHSVRMTTPYFTPGKLLLPALEAAVKRGAVVELVLSNYSKFAPYVVGKHESGRLLESGIHIYYYEPTMLHLKMMIIDNEWAAIGSCNLDGLSLHQNEETMLVSTHPGFVEQLNQHFDEDVQKSIVFDMEQWKNRPLVQKAGGYILRPFKRFL